MILHTTLDIRLYVYNETINDSIGRYILFVVKFYAYVQSGALDGFVLLRTFNDRKRLFLDKQEHVEFRSNRFHNLLYENARTYQRTAYFFCQNLDLNRTNKNLDKVSHYSIIER